MVDSCCCCCCSCCCCCGRLLAELGERRAALIGTALAENPADVEKFHLFAESPRVDVGVLEDPVAVGGTAEVDEPVLLERVVSARPTHDVSNDAEAATAVAVSHPDRSTCSRPLRHRCAAQHQQQQRDGYDDRSLK